MRDTVASASSAAFDIGYESVSQFTREYARLFGAPQKRDAMRSGRAAGAAAQDGSGTTVVISDIA